MLTSSIERRGFCSRSNGASATSSRPAARSSSSSARSVTCSRAGELLEIGEREAGDRRAAGGAATSVRMRSSAAARDAGDADDPDFAGGRRNDHRRRELGGNVGDANERRAEAVPAAPHLVGAHAEAR